MRITSVGTLCLEVCELSHYYLQFEAKHVRRLYKMSEVYLLILTEVSLTHSV
jgi:hypothetical protein